VSFTLLPLLFIIITHREITISTGVLVIDLFGGEMHNTTPSLARSFKRRSLFGDRSGCIGWRRVRGSKCARFEVHTVDGGEDMSNILLLMCDKGGALWNHTTIILYLLLLVSIMMPLDWGN